jgi:hypothetical protein
MRHALVIEGVKWWCDHGIKTNLEKRIAESRESRMA